MRSVSQWVKKCQSVSLNFLRNLAQALGTFQHYIKQCVLCINTFQFATFPSQRELALITGETRRKMGRLETQKGITKPNSLLHNAFRGHAYACGVPPDEQILNNKWYSAKPSSLQYPLCILSHGWAHLNQHPYSGPYTHYGKPMHTFISCTQTQHTVRTVGAAIKVTD